MKKPLKKPFSAFLALSIVSALLPVMAIAQSTTTAPSYSGVATVRYSGGTSNGNSLPAHVTFPQTCENPQIVTQTYVGGGKCAMGICPNTPHSTSTDIRSSIGNVTTSGFDVYATADDAIVAQDIQIGWHVICGPNHVVRPASPNLVSGTITTRYDGSHLTHSRDVIVPLPASCGTPSIVTETHTDSVACNLSYTGTCYNNAGTTSSDLYPQISVPANLTYFSMSVTSDDIIQVGAGGDIKMSYQAMCQNPVEQTVNKFVFGGVTQVTYGNAAHSSITHVDFPRTCKNPTVVAQSYVDGMKCVLYGGACNNNRGTTSSDIYAYAINVTETGMNVFASADDVMAGGGRQVDIGYHVTCEGETAALPQCSDGMDNADAEDTLADAQDPGCYTNGVYNPNDNDETNVIVSLPQCSDGVDNADAEDTLADINDPGCYTNGIYNPQDNDETNMVVSLPQCSDGLDNDNDGKVDFFDPGCYPNGIFNPPAFNPNDIDESNTAQLCRWTRLNSQWVRTCS